MPYVLKCHTTNEPTLKKGSNGGGSIDDDRKKAEEDRRWVLFSVNLVLACGMVGIFSFISYRLSK